MFAYRLIIIIRNIFVTKQNTNSFIHSAKLKFAEQAGIDLSTQCKRSDTTQQPEYTGSDLLRF